MRKTLNQIRVQNILKYCTGCLIKRRMIHNKSVTSCIIATYNKCKECPCLNCLVKVTCDKRNRCKERVHLIAGMQYDKPYHRSDNRLDFDLFKELKVKRW
jgi:hypothetical protein